MKRLLPLLIAAALLLIEAGSCYAQVRRGYNPYIRRPTVSPYINLQRAGSPDVIYHGIVAPELEAYQFREQHDLAIRQLQGQVQGLEQPRTGATGHQSYFLNYSHFYPNSPSGERRP